VIYDLIYNRTSMAGFEKFSRNRAMVWLCVDLPCELLFGVFYRGFCLIMGLAFWPAVQIERRKKFRRWPGFGTAIADYQKNKCF
jgi:hypothetical protein